MIYYTNSNAPGDVHEREERSARLDALPNWTSHDTREAAEQAAEPHRPGLVVSDGVLHRPGMTARRPSIVAPDGTVPEPLVVLDGPEPLSGAGEVADAITPPEPEVALADGSGEEGAVPPPRPDLVAGDGTGEDSDEPEKPARSAPVAEWERYAVARGMTDADAKAATKAELIARFG